ncbi:MAG: VacB/RNase II family 3'-5' exoribonuclease [Kofleriaceae bacterium]
MTIERDDILDGLRAAVTRGIKFTALADAIGARKGDYAGMRATLGALVAEGLVRALPGGGFALAPHGRGADKKARPGLPWAEPAATPSPSTPASTPTTARARRTTARSAAAIAPPPPPVTAAAPRTRRVRPSAAPPPAIEPEELPTGRLTVHPAGYGFVGLPDGRDVFIPAKYRGASLDGDQVRVATWVGIKGTEGRVIDVLARGRARLTGILRTAGRRVFLEPDDPRVATDFGQVTLEGGPPAADGQAVVVEITRYPEAGGHELAGRVLKVLGDPDDPRTEIEKILACAAVPIEFPAAALAQAERTAQTVGPADLADRIDLRDRRFCTIDPETARDYDDALCIEDGPDGGTRVWVAVADVSHYVRWDDPLDRESTLRGVSVYLPDRVIPMLPHQLSSNICSLLPDVDRCAMVVRLDYDREARLVGETHAAAVIRSQARLDYPGVASALRGDFRGRREAYRPWQAELERLNALAQLLRAQRRARGTLDLDLPEPKVILDADDPRLVRDVVRAKGDPDVKGAYQLVEEFMIAANESVGRFFRKRDAPTVWRVHAPPKRERVEELAQILGGLGIEVDVDHALTPLGMKEVLDQVMATSAARSLSFLVLRSLKQAVWDTVPIGHFGLASGDYVHFTSPIRRYPDLLVHRLLKHYLHKDGLPAGGAYREPPPDVTRLAELAAGASGHERRAMEAEREAVAMYRCYLVRDQIGERFAGTVSAVTSFGAFVELDAPYVEGLIKLESLGHDIGYDEARLRLRARRSGFTLAMGDAVTVELFDVSVARRKIELRLVPGHWLGRRRARGGGRAAAGPRGAAPAQAHRPGAPTAHRPRGGQGQPQGPRVEGGRPAVAGRVAPQAAQEVGLGGRPGNDR